MNRIEIDVITGEQKVIPLTPLEIAEAEANYKAWLAAQPTKAEQIAKLQAEQIAKLQAQIDALKGAA